MAKERKPLTADEAMRAWAEVEAGDRLTTPGPRGYDAGEERGLGGGYDDPRGEAHLRVWRELDDYCGDDKRRGRALPKLLMWRYHKGGEFGLFRFAHSEALKDAASALGLQYEAVLLVAGRSFAKYLSASLAREPVYIREGGAKEDHLTEVEAAVQAATDAAERKFPTKA